MVCVGGNNLHQFWERGTMNGVGVQLPLSLGPRGTPPWVPLPPTSHLDLVPGFLPGNFWLSLFGKLGGWGAECEEGPHVSGSSRSRR